MSLNRNCVFSEEIKEKIYMFYRESDLEAMEYANSVLKEDKEMEKYIMRYKAEPTNIDEQDTDIIDIFWESMDYIGMTDYIRQRESEI